MTNKRPTNDKETQALAFQCSRVFSPATPIHTRDLFAGRTDQIRLVGQAAHTVGQHAIIFGERGVGKTSLANVLKALLSEEESIVVKINCHNNDTFAKVWAGALSEIQIIEEDEAAGIRPHKRTSIRNLADAMDDNVGPEDVRRILYPIARHKGIVIIFDEFDRMRDRSVQALFADTIKNFSDNALNATLVIVGVANDISGLIQQHASVDRSLIQIKMPRMRPDELQGIINKAMQELKMTIEKKALDLLVMLSQGLPHYTHLLGSEATILAIYDGRKKTTLADAKKGVTEALGKAQHSILESYKNATHGQRKGAIFEYVLLACALAEVDEQGYFISAGVRGPLSKITGKSYDIPGFSQHLNKFSSDPNRGPVLEKAGTSRRFRFRFINPLLQPYIIMRGLANGALKGDLQKLLGAKYR